MHYFFLVLAVIAFAGLGIFFGKFYSSNGEETYQKKIYAQYMQDGKLDRNELRSMLKELPEAIDRELKPGAMCYKVAFTRTPETVDYVCPSCGEKTVYSGEVVESVHSYLERIDDYRRITTQIKGIDVTLDETQFCRKCSPDTQNPRLGLVVRHSGEKDTHRVKSIEYRDLEILVEFSKGSVTYFSPQGTEFLLDEVASRLEYLLGIDIEKTTD